MHSLRLSQLAQTVRRVLSIAAPVALAGSSAFAQASGGGPEGLLPWSKVQHVVQEFERISPAPPPLETTLLGTFDASSGEFIWGPAIELWEVPVDMHYDELAIGSAFEASGIGPLVVDLDPQVVGLSSVGLSAAISGPGAGVGALGKPSPASGVGGSKAKGAAGTGGEPQRFRGHPFDRGVMRTFVRAGKVDFVVEVVNRGPQDDVVLCIDGTTTQVLADRVDVIVPPRDRHVFEVRCGTKSFGDKLVVVRPPLLGTFTLAALPVTLVYEPPGGTGCKQTYTSVHRAGTELRGFRSTESSTTQPVDTPFSTLTGYVEIAQTVGGAAQSVPHPGVQAAGSAVSTAAGVLSAALGSQTVDQEVEHTVTDSHTLALEVVEGSATATSEGLGPGQGDVFHFLVEPTFAWIAVQDPETGKVYVSTTLLGHHGVARYSARSLREHTMAVPSAEMQDLLLALDPLAPEYVAPTFPGKLGSLGVPFQHSPAPRLAPLAVPMVYVSGASGSFWVSHTLSSADEHAEVDVTTTTTQSTAGFLSYVSSAVPSDGESRVRVRQGRSTVTTTSDTVEVRVDLVAQSGDTGLALEVSFDRLFGTFAFRPVEMQAQALSGTVSDGSGLPVGDEPVLLTFADGRSLRTRTDPAGRFSVRPPTKVSGPIVVRSGGARTSVDWTGSARSGVELRGARAQAASSGSGGKKKAGGKGLPDPGTVPIKASEGDTATAIRGRPSEAQREIERLRAEVARLEGELQELKTRLAATTQDAATSTGASTNGRPISAGARKSTPTGPAEIVADPSLRGRLGRLVVQFPEGAAAQGSSIEVFRGDAPAGSSYGALSKDLLPGEYTVVVQKRRVEHVEVRTGHVTRVHVGVLRLQGDSDTAFRVYEPGAKTAFFNCYGPHDVGLTPGKLEVEVGGVRVEVQIVAGEIVEF